MRKEIVWAIILGVIMGGIIIFGINLANKSASNNSPVIEAVPTALPTTTPKPTLQITSTDNNSVSFQDSIVLSGKAKNNSFVAIIWEDDQAIIQSDESGNWEKKISLVGGENTIEVLAADGQSYQESTKLTIIYTTADMNSDDEDSSSDSKNSSSITSEEATPSSDSVNENLKQRIQEIVLDKLNNSNEPILKGYVGTITKINDINLVINVSENETLQITTNENTDIVRDGKDIDISDLSIEEKIIAIGYLDPKDILTGERIVTLKAITPTSTRMALVGAFSQTDTLSIVINELVIEIPKKSDIDTENINEDQMVMAIIETTLKDNSNTLLSLQPLLQ